MTPDVPSVHRQTQMPSEPHDQFRRLPILNAGELGVAGITRVVLDAYRGQALSVRVPSDVLVEHALDDGSVPADNVMRRLLMPYAMRCVPLFWRAEDVLRRHSGVHRRSVGGMKDDRVDLSGSLNGVSIRVRGNPDRARKAIASHRNLPSALLNRYRRKRPQPGCVVTLMTRDVDGHRFEGRSLRAQPGGSVETSGCSCVRST